MKNKYSAFFLICCTWLSCNVSVAGTPFHTSIAINNYNFNSEQAIIFEKTNSDYQVMFADFKNMSARKIIRGNIGSFAVSENGVFLAYIENLGEKITIIHIVSGKKIYFGGRADQNFLQWSNVGNKLTYFDERVGRLYVVDVDDKLNVYSVKADADIITAKWNVNCHCFYYQFMPIEDPGLYGVFRINNGKLIKTKEKSILVSPNGQYYLQPQAVFETANYLSVYDTNSDKLLSKFDTGSLLQGQTGIIWKGNIVRMLGYPSGSINVEIGKILSSRNGDLMAYDKLRKYSPHNYFDLASDNYGYILMWNIKKKIFEVEDIGTGKTIKTYKKFW